MSALPPELFCKKGEHRLELRYRNDAAGRRYYVRQCLDCGRSMGGAVSAAVAAESSDEIKPFDDDLLSRREQEIRDYWRERDAERQATRERYDQYLASPQWAAKREQVLARDNHLCQGCRSRRAAEVHHITYDHVGDELLFELISLCRDCHARAHGGQL